MAVTETILIGSKADTRGFKKAESAATKLNKTLKNVAKTLGVAYGVKAITSFGIAAAKAYAADEAAAARLAKTVENLGLSFENVGIAKFINELSLAAGVTDDELRPALQSLITTTGSVATSQRLLTQAIDISRGSGVDLGTVVNDLAQAYVGNLKGLKKYYLGLTQAELATMTFAEIQAKLAKQFSGSSAAYLDTYAGKMDAFAVAASEAKEIIGKGMLDALMKLSGNTSIKGLTDDMMKFANTTADIMGNLATVLRPIAWLFEQIGKGVSFLASYGDDLSRVGYDAQGRELRYDPNTGASLRYGTPEYNAGTNKRPLSASEKAAQIAAEKAAKARAAELAKIIKMQKAAQAAQEAAAKKALILKKAGSIFDMEQIQIIAALKGKISDEERTRLELQLAIATGNEKVASDLTYKLAIAQGLTVKLAQELASLPMANNPFAAWAGYLDAIELQAKRIAAFGVQGVPVVTPSGATALASIPMTTYGQNTYVPSSTYADIPATGLPSTKYNAGTYVPSSAYADRTPIVVQIDGKAVASALQDQSLNGNQTIVNRTTGSFSDW